MHLLLVCSLLRNPIQSHPLESVNELTDTSDKLVGINEVECTHPSLLGIAFDWHVFVGAACREMEL